MHAAAARIRAAAVAAAAIAVAGAAPAAVAPPSLQLTLAEFDAPSVALRGLAVSLEGPGYSRMRLSVAEARVAGHTVRDLRLDCARARFTDALVACDAGTLRWAGSWPVRASYDRKRQVLVVDVEPPGSERLHIVAELSGDAPRIAMEATAVDLARLAPWLPAGVPAPKAGRVDATATWDASASRLAARAKLREFAFADAAGMRVGEKLALELEIGAAAIDGGGWSWEATASWEGGEVYWHPFYAAGDGQRLQIRGAHRPGDIEVHDGRLALPGMGEARFEARLDPAGPRLVDARLRADEIDIAGLYRTVLKPLALDTPFSELRLAGKAGVSARWAQGALEQALIEFSGVSFEDERRRFALFGASGRLPWEASRPTEGEVRAEGGEVLALPFGATEVPLRFEGRVVSVRRARVPLFGGSLVIGDAHAQLGDAGWTWTFAAAVDSVSVAQLTAGLGWPVMHGRLSADVPQVTYAGATLRVGGPLRFEVFEGEATVAGLVVEQPFGRAPRLQADIEMRGLDLGIVTRTFAFGSMTGRIDATIADLELQNWTPVSFDARIESSPGDYPRRISQRAIESLSALGGGGSAALQSMFLGLFEEFGYRRLGWSCSLRDGVCEMGGVAPRGDGYVLVEGGGLPSITVLGYNRRVSWEVLLARLARITHSDAKPVIR